MILRQWHDHRRRISAARDRRFLGVVGLQHQQMTGIVLYEDSAGTVDFLSLVLRGARPMLNAAQNPAANALGDVPQLSAH